MMVEQRTRLHCEVQLENQYGIFQPGQEVSGRVTLTLQERALIKAFGIKVSGYAYTHWENQLKDKMEKKTKKNPQPQIIKRVEIYENRDDFISVLNYFMGSEEAFPKIIDAGIYTYKFTVQLPNECPSSFEGSIGQIRYELDAFIDDVDSHYSCFNHVLRMHSPLDLRQCRDLMQQHEVIIINKKPFGRFWQHPLQLHVDIPQMGYIPGEVISVHVKLLNTDHLKLNDLAYKLNLVATYTGLLKKKSQVKVLRTNLLTTLHTLGARKDAELEHLQNIHIPETPPTTEAKDCKCLQVEYEVEVMLTTAVKNRWVSAQVPIKIGTISLRNNMQRLAGEEFASSTQTLTMARSLGDLSKVPTANEFAIGAASAPTSDTPTGMYPSTSALANEFMPTEKMPL